MNWIHKIKDKFKKLDKEHEYISRREGTMYNLLVELETEESIKMFEEISILFRGTIEKRLNRVTEEKSNIEKFLEDGKNI